jgi:hypothetical protein
MAQRSPTLEGFRIMFRRPSLTLAEIAWRLSFWAAGIFLSGALIVEYLDTLPVHGRDLLFLDSGQPVLVAKAIDHIFRGTSLRLILGAIVVVSALGFAWTLIAAVGRSATLRAIQEYFSDRSEVDADIHAQRRSPISPLAGLNLLRLAAVFAATIAAIGAILLPARILASRDGKPILAFVITLALLSLVGVLWTLMNWELSLSAIFAVRDGSDSFGALAAASRFSRDRAAGFWAINFWFTLTHAALFFVGTTAASMVLGMAGIVPAALVLAGVLIVTLLYFIAADWIHVGRMAAWFYLVVTPVVALSPPPVAAFATATATPAATVALAEFPAEDDILSDIEARTHFTPIEPKSEG